MSCSLLHERKASFESDKKQTSWTDINKVTDTENVAENLIKRALNSEALLQVDGVKNQQSVGVQIAEGF